MNFQAFLNNKHVCFIACVSLLPLLMIDEGMNSEYTCLRRVMILQTLASIGIGIEMIVECLPCLFFIPIGMEIPKAWSRCHKDHHKVVIVIEDEDPTHVSYMVNTMIVDEVVIQGFNSHVIDLFPLPFSNFSTLEWLKLDDSSVFLVCYFNSRQCFWWSIHYIAIISDMQSICIICLLLCLLMKYFDVLFIIMGSSKSNKNFNFQGIPRCKNPMHHGSWLQCNNKKNSSTTAENGRSISLMYC